MLRTCRGRRLIGESRVLQNSRCPLFATGLTWPVKALRGLRGRGAGSKPGKATTPAADSDHMVLQVRLTVHHIMHLRRPIVGCTGTREDQGSISGVA